MTSDLIDARTHGDGGFGLTAITRLHHAALHRLAKEMGTQKAAARHLGISHCLFNQWVNLKSAPPKGPHNHGGGKWRKPFFDEIAEKLFTLTGQTWDELWPQELREAVEVNGLITQQEQFITVNPQNILMYAREEAARLEQLAVVPVEAAQLGELRESLIQALKHLNHREREVIKLRFGIGHDQAYTLEECSHIFRISRERVRMLEARAMRRLRGYVPGLTQYLPGRERQTSTYHLWKGNYEQVSTGEVEAQADPRADEQDGSPL